jgi:hypothetical protein
MGLDAGTSRHCHLPAEAVTGTGGTFPTTGRGFVGRGWD